MRVRALGIMHADGSRIEADYLVLAILAKAGSALQFIVLDEEGFPLTITSDGVTILDAHVPRSWTNSIDDNGTMFLQPGPWHEAGFWSAFWDEWHPAAGTWGASRARDLFDQELARLANDEE